MKRPEGLDKLAAAMAEDWTDLCMSDVSCAMAKIQQIAEYAIYLEGKLPHSAAQDEEVGL
jgi:hypothetical protein